MIEELLKLRDEIKYRKPVFKRQDYPKKKALGEKWRRPAGIHSKRRRKFRGAGPYPSSGYRSPRIVRGLTPEGFKGRIVNSPSDLAKLDEKACVISSTVGKKKRLAIIQEAQKLEIKILNIKNAEAYIKLVNEELKKRKEAVKARKEKKTKQKKVEPKKEEKKELTAEEKKKAESEEKKKIIEGR